MHSAHLTLILDYWCFWSLLIFLFCPALGPSPSPLAIPQLPCILRRFIAPCWGMSLSYAPFSLLVGENMWG